MKAGFNDEFWKEELRKVIILKLTTETDEAGMTSLHYQMLEAATTVHEKTLKRFLRYRENINPHNINLLSAYALFGKDDLKTDTKNKTDYFIQFIKSKHSAAEESPETEPSPEASGYTDWLGNEKELLMIYEVAFLWHGQEPPAIASHVFLMTRKMEETKQKLHDAITAGDLKAAHQVINPDGTGTRWVSKTDLRAFAEKIGQYPEFLFPK